MQRSVIDVRVIVQELQPGTAPNTCTMVRKQNRSICNIFKLVNRGRDRRCRSGCGGGWHVSKRKHSLIEDDISRNIHTIRWNMETLVPLMERAITQEDTLFRAKLKLTIVVRPKMRPTSTPKHFEESIVRCIMQQFFNGCIHIENTSRQPIYKKTGCMKSITPKMKG